MKVNKQKVLGGLKYVGIFLIYLITQYKFLNDPWFVDEMDVMLGGKTIAAGYQLYGDYISQHMPFTYYLSALFDWLGANTITLQRLAFYLFYALMWTIIFARYKKVVNKVALFFYPILFSGLISYYERGTTVLSEHLAGIGFVILLLEFLHFYENRKLKVDNYIAISVAVVLTFGTVFIGAFGVAVIAVGVLCREIQWAVSEKKKFSVFLKDMLKKYIPLGCWVAVPWVILLVYYCAKDNVKIAFYSAYRLNREIYPKYYYGYGESILKTLLGCVDNFMTFIQDLFTPANFGFQTVLYVIVIVSVVGYFIRLFEKKKTMLGIVLIVFLLEVGSRGFFTFHSTQWVELAALLTMIFICDSLIVSKEKFGKRSLAYRMAVVCVLMVLSASYLKNLSDITNRNLGRPESDIGNFINSITEEDEAVWFLTFSFHTPLMADRAAIQNIGNTPWMHEGLSERVYTIFGEEPPRVALYDETCVCWDYALTDYAPELVTYMQEHYTRYGETELYIRNDYYEEACQIIAGGY